MKRTYRIDRKMSCWYWEKTFLAAGRVTFRLMREKGVGGEVCDHKRPDWVKVKVDLCGTRDVCHAVCVRTSPTAMYHILATIIFHVMLPRSYFPSVELTSRSAEPVWGTASTSRSTISNNNFASFLPPSSEGSTLST